MYYWGSDSELHVTSVQLRNMKSNHTKPIHKKPVTTQKEGTHKTMFSNIKNIVKKIGFTAAALALAAGIASAPAASASDLSPSNSPVPVVEQQAGILQVLVGFPTASTQQATVSVYSVSGDVYYSAVTGPNGEVSL